MFENIIKSVGVSADDLKDVIPPARNKPAVEVKLSAPAQSVDTSSWPDKREAVCPNCEAELLKIPGSKTKCSFCQKYMYVRTDPRTKSRRLVVEAELEPIEEAWAIIGGYHSEYLAAKAADAKQQSKMKVELGREPTPYEFEIEKLRRERLANLKDKAFGLYRNTYLEEAQAHYKEKNYLDALICFLAVVLLDGNGASNNAYFDLDDLENANFDAPFEGFNVEDVDYLPYIADRVRLTLKRGELTLEQGLSGLEQIGIQVITGCQLGIRAVWPKFAHATQFNAG
jgi:hypothetical protein